MVKITYNHPPKIQEMAKMNDYLIYLHNAVFGLGDATDGILDSDNVEFAEARARSTHTGTQPSSTISDFNESVDDEVANLIQDGEALTWTYQDSLGKLTGEVTKSADPGDLTIVTTEIADAVYSTNERDMLNNLKTDVTNIIAKANLLLDYLQAAKLME